MLRTASFDLRGAEAEFRRALELAPGHGDAKVYLAESLATFGQLDKAVELIRQALASDPPRTTKGDKHYDQLSEELFTLLNRTYVAVANTTAATVKRPSGAH